MVPILNNYSRPGFGALYLEGRRRKRSVADPLRVGLVSYWPLNETSGTRLDVHGANHLTDNNTVTRALGIRNEAGQFTRANSEYLSIPHNASLSLSNTSFTIALWACLDSL